VIEKLQDDFVNSWVLARDLKALAQSSANADFQKLCGLIEANYDYPVDSVLISPELQVLGHVNVNAAVPAGSHGYLAFLNGERADASVGGDDAWVTTSTQGHSHSHDHSPAGEPLAPSPELVLSPDEPQGNLLDVVRSAPQSQVPFVLYPLDTRAFSNGGVLVIEVEVGTSECAASFELLRMDVDHIPASMYSVASMADVQPGHSRTLKFAFQKGEQFHLLARAANGTLDGSVNAFRAEIQVTQKRSPQKAVAR
jgi:hypothetical protein